MRSNVAKGQCRPINHVEIGFRKRRILRLYRQGRQDGGGGAPIGHVNYPNDLSSVDYFAIIQYYNYNMIIRIWIVVIDRSYGSMMIPFYTGPKSAILL